MLQVREQVKQESQVALRCELEHLSLTVTTP